MDPVENMRKQIEVASAILSGDTTYESATELAELVETLHDQRKRDGEDPALDPYRAPFYGLRRF